MSSQNSPQNKKQKVMTIEQKQLDQLPEIVRKTLDLLAERTAYRLGRKIISSKIMKKTAKDYSEVKKINVKIEDLTEKYFKKPSEDLKRQIMTLRDMKNTILQRANEKVSKEREAWKKLTKGINYIDNLFPDLLSKIGYKITPKTSLSEDLEKILFQNKEQP